MEFLSIILSFFSYTIFAYVGFSIFGRRKIVAYIILGVLFAQGLYNFIPYVIYQASLQLIVIVFAFELLPVIAAFMAFKYLTRTPGVKKYKRPKGEKQAKLNPIIYPSKYIKVMSLTLLIVSSLIGIIFIALYLFDMIDISLLNVSIIMTIIVISVLYSIYMILFQLSLKEEKVMIFIGKQKEKCFAYDLNQLKKPFTIKDIYQNESFIIDQIGDLSIYQGYKLKEKYYIFWIATSTSFDIHQRGFYPSNKKYDIYLENVSKYQVVHMKLYEDAYGKLHQNKK